MLRLKLPTDPRWVNIVETNIEEILTDHAWCEQKAASNAITIITINSEYPNLVTDMLSLAKEEIEHFEMVHEIIKKRGLKLGRERKDEYVGELAQYMKRSNTGSRVSGFVERMLFSAMIEARREQERAAEEEAHVLEGVAEGGVGGVGAQGRDARADEVGQGRGQHEQQAGPEAQGGAVAEAAEEGLHEHGEDDAREPGAGPHDAVLHPPS